VLRLPLRTYKQLFYYSRPDTTHKQLRAAEWGKLYSHWRFVHSLFVYIGVRGEVFSFCCVCVVCWRGEARSRAVARLVGQPS
jgi:hypothetical protein